jgi:hypothetical protein
LACAVALALAAPGAGAAEAPDHPMLGAITGERIGPLEQFKDACGVALDGHGDVYVADYYGNRVVVFSPGWGYLTQIDGIEPPDAAGVRPVAGPRALAVDPAGNLYVASYHGELRRYQPTVYPPGEGTGYGSGETVDPGPVTGVAVDPATGDLYVDRRTSIARYAGPVDPGDAPVQEIGAENLRDGYGLALSGFPGSAEYPATTGFLYVADAGTDTVKAYDPATSLTYPVQEIRGDGTAEGSFHLEDAELAVDPHDGHLYISNDLEPDFEARPELVVDEFSPRGYYRGSVPPSFLGGVASFLQAGEPSDLAIAAAGPYAGDLFVSSGNWEGAAVYAFGPPAPRAAQLLGVSTAGTGQGTVTSVPAAISCGPVCAGEFDAGATVVLKASAAAGSAFAGWSGCDSEPAAGSCAVRMDEPREVTARFESAPAGARLATVDGRQARPGAGPPPASGGAVKQASARRASGTTVVRKGNLQLALSGSLSPRALPRRGAAPVAVSLAGQVSTTDGSMLPQLERLQIELNRGGRLEMSGLPTCPLARIAVASSAQALSACRGALLGQGSFHADIVLRGQPLYPTTGKLLVFNAIEHGRPLLYAHLYSAEPFATSFVIRFKITQRAHGRFGTVLSASLPEALGDWGHLTAIEMRLSRRYSAGGRALSYISAGCPAPAGFPGAVFTLARTTFSFAGGRSLQADLVRNCRVR